MTIPQPGITLMMVQIAIVKDLLNEVDEYFFLNLSNPVNATLADPQGKATIIDDDGEVTDIDFVQIEDDGFGILETGTNPAMFEGGDRFFPDARAFATRTVPENYVRVRATVVGAQEGDRVYFRSFDVDDPTNDAGPSPPNEDLIDFNDYAPSPRTRRGADNRGTLNGSDVPGPTLNPSGFVGLLRPIFANGSAGVWSTGRATSEVQPSGIAEVDMATSFAAGDNYRVVASTVLEPVLALNATTDVPTTGTTPALTEFLTVGQGAVTGQLSVWRRIHIEQDRMQQPEGDWEVGLVLAGGSHSGSTATVPTNIDAEADEYAGGVLVKESGTALDIVGNTAGPDSVFTVTSAVPVPIVTVTVYQDDYGRSGNVVGLRVNTESQAGLYDYLQENKERDPNRFADAYMQPDLDTLDQFDSLIPPHTHVELGTVEAVVGSHRGAKDDETDLFWVTYVSTAFDGPDTADYDPIEPTVMGLTTTTNTISLVFLEPIRDIIAAGGGQPHVVDHFTGVARVTVHEVGHQFFTDGLPDPNEHRDNPDNIMDTFVFTVAADDYYFASEEVATLRMRVASP